MIILKNLHHLRAIDYEWNTDKTDETDFHGFNGGTNTIIKSVLISRIRVIRVLINYRCDHLKKSVSSACYNPH